MLRKIVMSFRWLVVVGLNLTVLGALAWAGSIVDQGSPGKYGAWAVTPSAQIGSANSEQCVTNAVGGTAITVPANTHSFILQNNGPNHVNCTTDGSAPVVNSLGLRIAGLASGETSVADALSFDCTAAACPTVKCIAASAPQVTGGCIQFAVVK